MARFLWQEDGWLSIPEIAPRDAGILAAIDELLGEISAFRDAPFFGDVQKEAFSEEIYSSWRIEGIELAIRRESVDAAFAGEGRLGRMLGYVSGDGAETPEGLAALHDAAIFQGARGFRIVPVGVGTPDGDIAWLAPPPERVPGLMEELCSNLGSGAFPAHYLRAYAHAALACIHPFEDGNGRVARLAGARNGSRVLAAASKRVFLGRASYYAALQAANAEGSLRGAMSFILWAHLAAYEDVRDQCANIAKYLEIHGVAYPGFREAMSAISWDAGHEDEYL